MFTSTTTDPDFPMPRPPQQASFAPGSTFVVIDLVTPLRSEHDDLTAAMAAAEDTRFPDDKLIVVYSGTTVVAVLSASGARVDD